MEKTFDQVLSIIGDHSIQTFIGCVTILSVSNFFSHLSFKKNKTTLSEVEKIREKLKEIIGLEKSTLSEFDKILEKYEKKNKEIEKLQKQDNQSKARKSFNKFLEYLGNTSLINDDKREIAPITKKK